MTQPSRSITGCSGPNSGNLILVNDNGETLFPDTAQEAELVVRIYNKEGRVACPIPASIRDRARAIAKQQER